ncbi:MAG: selenocysteine-specific translation elongation factor [Oscillospiraceae bacterium]|nr:selenocysteine-specific translation elongation factor [Oscillospiraceae bacterium]
MKHVIIGTAGHVDHGKTLLIKALTGIETDRLIEEKKRGITIELGFAHVEWEDGVQAGIVDVPGHEKFIKNMLAGAGGIDLCMLVVAADEGFMPQTIEHLDILDLLGIHDGLVVITKKDMVDPDWLEMMQEEIHERVQGTFLEGKPVLTVSAYTGEGIDELKEHLHRLVLAAQEKNMRVPFRLPIDRVFSVDGFGTVVTGTLIDGCMNEGDAAELVPSGAQTRIRNLQVHGKDVRTAYAGQRVAVNLAGLHKSDVKRGDAVAKPGCIRVSRMLDVKLRCLRDSQRVIANDSRVHLYHGTEEQVAKVVLLDREQLLPGESCYAQLRMSEPMAAKNGDRFVIRFFSPLETIGGGVILDDAPFKHKRNDASVLEALRIKESGSGGDKVLQTVAEFGTALPDLSKLAAKLGVEGEELLGELRELVSQGRVVEALEGRYAASGVVDSIWKNCESLLAGYHKQNPLHAGMKPAELRQKLFKGTDQTIADAFLRELCREGRIKRMGERYALADFNIHFTKRQTAIRGKLLDIFEKADIEPAFLDDIMATFPPNEKADCKQVLDSVLSGGELVMLSPQICYHYKAYEKVCRVTQEHFASNETLVLAQLRDALGTSRKYALAILEYFDRLRITRKDGDFRYLDKGFEEKY